ncbi:MAG: hypothetical protein IJS53_02005 [Clostridia bacterium]|nr:hypothetical protein [Clostridia bacterium]
MRYHIDTIPVWDAVRENGECPLCSLRRKEEARSVENALGGSVMEPEARVRVNEKGFCARHHALLYARQNRLGHALMTHTHLLETQKRVHRIFQKANGDAPRRLFGKGNPSPLLAAADALDVLTASCALCEEIDAAMRRYAYTLLHLWTHDAAFASAFESGKGVCLKDAALLLRMADEALSAAQQRKFAKTLARLTEGSLSRVAGELEWFTLKFDYRNADKPWNASRDALERAVLKLRGGSLGSPNDAKK